MVLSIGREHSRRAAGASGVAAHAKGQGSDPRDPPASTFETFLSPAGPSLDIPAADDTDDPHAAAITEIAPRLVPCRRYTSMTADRSSASRTRCVGCLVGSQSWSEGGNRQPWATFQLQSSCRWSGDAAGSRARRCRLAASPLAGGAGCDAAVAPDRQAAAWDRPARAALAVPCADLHEITVARRVMRRVTRRKRSPCRHDRRRPCGAVTCAPPARRRGNMCGVPCCVVVTGEPAALRRSRRASSARTPGAREPPPR